MMKFKSRRRLGPKKFVMLTTKKKLTKDIDNVRIGKKTFYLGIVTDSFVGKISEVIFTILS